ncbi:MAG TPA: filamentous hemagglutinin N-terminal domain-containing protein, partial [Acetobacteraceae bacterium]|nr:filamentous hemagglutinin N-terminal domain-containing protein [Acetobacteraceae bacterium]
MIMHPRLRLALLQASMLVAPALLAAPGMAQGLAPNAAPQGGQVVGGAASIGQTAARTTIDQSTNRAVIDWRSFDIGRDHTVQFRQPSTSSMTLNRVTGPNPSVIAGHITANGGIALVNQSGVVFTGGAQVQAQSVIVSTNDIGNAGFMQGGAMVFDRPGKPGARIENQGSITARQAGIAALVAPQVANSGVISAKLGTVVLAGATQQVIDLNGDGLVSFAVGAPVRTAPADGGALVSNTGTLRAQGGTVLLTAAAADGIVQNLVRAGGSISAATDAASGRTGTVLLSGTGGSIIVEGAVSASGRAPGTKGGSVTAVADRVLVAGTARVDASGRAGGGRIAIGTNGGVQAPGTALAARTGIAAGAVVRADATGRGNGGQIVVNSRDATVQAGSITARGGPQSGDGGVVEVSSAGAFQLTGQIDVGAAAGMIGRVIIDPTDLTIVTDGDSRINVGTADLADLILAAGDAPDAAFLSATVVGNITSSLTLQATNSITVSAGINKPLGGLEFDAGGNLAINAPV